MNKITKYTASALLAGGLTLGITACGPVEDTDVTIELGYVLWACRGGCS